MNYNSVNIPIEIKKIFLRFLQSYYSEHLNYKWDKDISKTKIVIVDKHSFDLGVAIKRPSIVISRGDFSWAFVTRGQYATNVANLSNDVENLGNSSKYNKKYTDLLRASISFNVLSGNGIVAENIANEVFVLLSGHKEEFKSLGIHQINSLGMGAEQIIRQRGYSEVDIYGVTVSMAFLYQQFLSKKERFYNVRIVCNDVELYENHDFSVIENGSKIKFIKPLPEGSTLTIYFTDAITEQLVISSLINETDLIYKIPDNKTILGYYKVTSGNLEIGIGL